MAVVIAMCANEYLRRDKVRWLVERGIAQRRALKISDSLKSLTEAIALDGRNPELYYELGETYSFSYWRGDYHKALASYSRAIELEPNHVASLFRRGCLYLVLNRDYEKAVADLTLVIAHRPPMLAQAYFRRAVAYKNLGRDSDFERDLKKARSLDPVHYGW
jgi:tetratricopeptide (TPR) repeat protein